MISRRPIPYNHLSYQERMEYMRHRASMFMKRSDIWLSKLTLQPKD